MYNPNDISNTPKEDCTPVIQGEVYFFIKDVYLRILEKLKEFGMGSSMQVLKQIITGTYKSPNSALSRCIEATKHEIFITRTVTDVIDSLGDPIDKN